jgi:hypothetical protein
MQGVWVFASAAARDAAVTSPQEGNFAYLKDTNVTTYYTGSAWANLDTTGMTNPMTTTGDIIYSSPGSTPVRLGIGTANQQLRVNSGATAPEWFTPAAASSALVYVGGASFSSSGTVNVNDVFSTTYSNYIMKADYVGSGSLNVRLRLRVSGSDNTASVYQGPYISAYSTSTEANRSSNGDYFNLMNTDASGSYISHEFYNPFATAKTGIIAGSINKTGSGDIEITRQSFAHTDSTSFTGFTLYTSTGTITGNVRVYGLVNS